MEFVSAERTLKKGSLKKNAHWLTAWLGLRRPKLIFSARLSLSAGSRFCALCATAEVSWGEWRRLAAEVHYWCKSAQVPGSRSAPVWGRRESSGDLSRSWRCLLTETNVCVSLEPYNCIGWFCVGVCRFSAKVFDEILSVWLKWLSG